MIATHDYKKNPESPVGNELDVNEGDTLVYLMTNENNEHWWLADDGKGQVGYVPATYLKIIRDVTRQEEESDTAGKEGYGKKIGGDMGQDGERRKTYSAAVIEGFKRNSAIYVGDSIVRKTDSRLNKGEDVVVCLPGASRRCPVKTSYLHGEFFVRRILELRHLIYFLKSHKIRYTRS